MAAWLVFIKLGAELLMLAFVILMLATGTQAVGLVALRGFVLILVAALNAYILFILRRLLWDRYDFHKMDTIIPVVACAAVILEILNQCTELMQVMNPAEEAKVVAVRVLLVVIPWGILILIYAAGLLKVPFSEKSLLRPYAYLNLAAGIILLSMILVFISPVFGLILFPFLVLTGVGSDILLGLTFLRSRETEQVEFV
jgi:hypothetical protein